MQLFLVLLGAVGFCRLVGAQSAGESEPVPEAVDAAAAPAPAPAAIDAPAAVATQSDVVPGPPQKVLVLQDGRVIQGDIESRAGGYRVRVASGSVIVPFGQVRLTAADIFDACRKLQESLKEPTAADHVALARWCMTNHLYDSAREQLGAALRLEPERKEARRLLVEVERLRDTQPPTQPAPLEQRLSDGFQRGEPETLGGLPGEIAQEFVRKVQPILVNKCGNAACHGAAGSSRFRLMPVRLGLGGHRAGTERNLSAVLGQIDVEHPEESPLLTRPEGRHGGSHKPIFHGPRAEEQVADLTRWVLAIARSERKPGAPSHSQPETAAGGSISPTAAEEPSRDFLDKVLAEERSDPFDPEVFNRLMHGGLPR